MQFGARRLALAEGVVAGVLFGTASVFIRFLEGFDASWLVLGRLAVASLFLLSILLVSRRQSALRAVRGNVRKVVVLGALLGTHFVLFTSAVKDTTILNATVLVDTAPMFAAIISTLVFKMKPSRTAATGLATSFVGIVIVGVAEATKTSHNAQGLLGDAEAVLSALVLAFYANYGKELRSRMNPIAAMVPVYAVAGAASAAYGVLTARMLPSSIVQPQIALYILGLGLLPTAVAHTLYFSSLSTLRPFETATFTLFEPVVAAMLGFVLFSEVPLPIFVLGAFLILVGVVLVLGKKGSRSVTDCAPQQAAVS